MQNTPPKIVAAVVFTAAVVFLASLNAAGQVGFTDAMAGLDNFFDMTESLDQRSEAGRTHFRSAGNADAFVRWSRGGGGFVPIAADTDVLEIDIADLGSNGRLQIRLEFADAQGKLVGNRVWYKRLRTPGLIALPSVRAFAEAEGVEGAAQYRLFFRLPRNRSMTLDEIRVRGEPTAAALPFLQRLALRQLRVTIDTGHPVPLVDANDPKASAPKMTVRNTSRRRMEVGAEFKATSFLGQRGPILHPEKLVLAAGETFTAALPLGDGRNDAWSVRYRFQNGDATHEAETHYAVLPFNPVEPRPHTGFHYAVAGGRFHLPESEVRKTVFAHRVLGVTHTRGDLTWNTIQPRPDRWNWKNFDRSVELYQEQGIEPQFLLGYSARWAVDESLRDAEDPTNWMFAPPDLNAWKNFVTEAVKRYADAVTYWEVWNEPDLTNFWKGTPREYIDLLRVSYRAIHDHDPDAQVMTGGFATLMSHGGRKHFHMMRDVLRDASDAFDVVAFHQHGTFDRFADIVDHELQDVLAVLPKPRPLYFNETAVGRGKGYAYQAESVVKKIAFTRSRGAIGHTWFTLVSGETFPWGIMLRDHEPLPAYVAYNALIRELAQLTFVRELDFGRGNYGLLFGDGERSLLISWSQSPDAARGLATLSIRDTRDHVRRLDLMGNAHAVEGIGDRVLIALGPRPSYLVVPAPAEAIEVDQRLIKVENPVVVYGDEPAHAKVSLHNPFDETIAVTVSREDAEPARYEIEPHATVAAAVAVRAPRDRRLRYGDRFDTPVTFAVAPLGIEREIAVPGKAGMLIPLEPQPGRPPDLLINDRPQVRNLFAYDPNSSDKVWAGPRDLSLEAWLQADHEWFIIRVKVRDDQHQPLLPGSHKPGDALTIHLDPDDSTDRPGFFATVFDGGEHGPVTRTRFGDHDWPRDAINTSIERSTNGITTYDLHLRLDMLGLGPEQLTRGIGMNLAVHDADLGVCEGWAQLAPGMNPAGSDEAMETVRVRFQLP